MLKVYGDNIQDYENPAKCIWEQIVIRFDRSESREAAEKSIVALGNDIVFLVVILLPSPKRIRTGLKLPMAVDTIGLPRVQ